MSTRPTTPLPQWANVEVEEAVIIDGNLTLVTNKVEPTSEFKQTGYLARQPYIRPYDNWFRDEICKWIDYLANSVEVGDFKVMSVTTTVADMETRFGGEWEDHGINTLGSVDAKIFERIA